MENYFQIANKGLSPFHLLRIDLNGYHMILNRLILDKGIPPLSFEKMPFFWLEGLLEDYSEELKSRKEDQEKYESKKSDGNFMNKVRQWSGKGSYKPPKI